MKIKVLHIVGGSQQNGSFKGAEVLHQALLKQDIDSKILNDSQANLIKTSNNADEGISTINNNFFSRFMNKLFVLIEKFFKFIILHSPRDTFTFGLLGTDLTKLKEYDEADIIHIHWLNQGFIKLKSLSKIDKPTVWTMRDMWPFTGGPHYTLDFKKYESGYLSKKMKSFKSKIYRDNFNFVAVSEWLKNEAQKSEVLKKNKIIKIYNNINLKDFKIIPKKTARSNLNISTKKQIILFGAQNPQSLRKGWEIFVNSLKKIDISSYYLLIFGNFWSHKTLDDIGIEYKSIGFVNDNKKLNYIYSSADFFVASSLQDAFAKTFVESLACGTPVICFSDTFGKEVIHHKRNGFIVDDFDADKLKNGIEWISNEIKKEKFKEKIFDDNILKFDSELIAKQYIGLYKSIFKNVDE